MPFIENTRVDEARRVISRITGVNDDGNVNSRKWVKQLIRGPRPWMHITQTGSSNYRRRGYKKYVVTFTLNTIRAIPESVIHERAEYSVMGEGLDKRTAKWRCYDQLVVAVAERLKEKYYS